MTKKTVVLDSESQEKIQDEDKNQPTLGELSSKLDQIELKIKSNAGGHPLLVALLTFIFTLVGAITVSYLTNKWNQESQIQVSSIDPQRIVYSKLMGKKFLRTQLYVSVLESKVKSTFYLRAWHIEGKQQNSVYLTELLRQKKRTEDLILRTAELNEKLFEIVGSAMVHFHATPEIFSINSSLMTQISQSRLKRFTEIRLINS